MLELVLISVVALMGCSAWKEGHPRDESHPILLPSTEKFSQPSTLPKTVFIKESGKSIPLPPQKTFKTTPATPFYDNEEGISFREKYRLLGERPNEREKTSTEPVMPKAFKPASDAYIAKVMKRVPKRTFNHGELLPI